MSSISGLWSQSESLWNPGITAENNLKRYEEAHADIDRKANVAEKKIMNDFFGSLKQQTTPDAIVIGSIIMLIFETFSIYAAYLMWNLQKKGYYLYLGGIALAFLAPLFLIGGWLGLVTSATGMFLSIFMAIFYAFNLKHLH
ncbi:hypothetical protein [Dyadobacter sp. NIV53]|uniref:hypothetical protein n=1 Tax=Dyadobacter sp. NIV53 TaxID=2861765 RepID=UPI001C8748AB|nr:hypothetical protein [Dyadobacter sp. NIV53]